MPDPINAPSAQVDINAPKFDAEGKNETKSISDAKQALEIARSIHRDDMRRDFERARVLAAFNGEAPYSDQELITNGQGYRFNLSFGFMEGVIGRATVPYNDLTSDNQYVANIKGDLPEEKLNIIRNKLTAIFDKWGEWPKFISRLIQDLVLNGWNNAIFPSDHGPWPMFIPQNQGFVHEMAENSAKGLDVFIWRKSYSIHELYEQIMDLKAAAKAGWNLDNVRKALENAAPKDLLQNRNDGGFTRIEEAIRGGTLYYTMVGGKVIEAYHVLAAEIDGSVTHYIVWDGARGDADVPNCELFKRERRWKSFEDVLVYFDLEPGDGKWTGSRGLGRRSFNTHRSVDKLRCGLLDQAFSSGLTLLQTSDQSGQEEFTFVVAGPFAVIPPGIQVATSSIPAISSTAFQVDALLVATSEQRVGDVVPNANSQVTGDSKTATQTKIEESRKLAISKSNLQRFLDPISSLMSIITRRLLIPTSQDPYAKEFQEALLKEGITREEMEKIRGARSTGRIETVTGNDAAAMQVVFAEFKNDPDVPQRQLKRRRIASILGPKDAESLVPDVTDDTQKSEAEREQKEEISTFLQGITLDALGPDAHQWHLPIALDWSNNQVQGLAKGVKGAPPQIIEAVLKHAGEHLSFLSQDPTKKLLVKQFSSQLKDISQQLSQIVQAVRAQAQPQQLPPGQPQQPPMQPQNPGVSV